MIRTSALLVLLLLALVFPWGLPNPAITSIAVFTLLYAASAIGWNTFSGFTGYISLGHATYFGLGAYTMALACQDWHIVAGLAPFLLLPLCGLVACLAAVPLGWIALRVRGNTFVVVSIAIIFTFQLLAYNLAGITNGSTGMDLPVPSWSGAVFNLPFYYASLALCLLALGVCWWVRNSKFGLGLLAIRDDEGRAISLGVRAGSSKLTAYVLSALFAGVAGGIYAYFVGSIYPPFAFDPNYDIAITLMSFFGGLGTVWGPLLGAVLIGPLQQYLTLQFGENGFSQILYGCLFLGTLLFLPEGIVPGLQQVYPRGRNMLAFLLQKRKNLCCKKNQG